MKYGADALAGPISQIINHSILQNHVPSSFKQALVTPIDKSDDLNCMGNYLPISVLPSISKLLEKVVTCQLSTHLETNNLLHNLQGGFRSYHSTQIILLRVSNEWLSQVDKGHFIGVIFVDLRKAFDSVNIPTLIQKLYSFGLTESAISWFTSYLSHRSQAVSINGYCSTSAPISKGVPQGSVLGPFLFSLFINDLPLSCKNTSTIMYADDTAIHMSSKDPKSVSTTLQHTPDHLLPWLNYNQLQFNIS